MLRRSDILLSVFSATARRFASLLLLLSLAACTEDSTLDQVEELKNKVCNCKDVACVTELRKNSQGLEEKLSQLDTDEMDRALKISVAMMKCANELGVPANGL